MLTLLTISAILLAVFAPPLLLARLLRPQPSERKRITLEPRNSLEIDVSCDPPVIPDPLNADPFLMDDKCGHCGGYQPVGYIGTHCYCCKRELASAVVDAGPTPKDAA